jgi:Patatin-like phospholipase
VPPTLQDHLFAPGPKRVLALDGGGVKGIVTIAFLEKIEEILRERSGRGNDFRLSDYFDLVGGTSVGALLATLVALGYPVSKIKQMFYEWTPQIFRRPWPAIPYITPRFTSRGLRKHAQRLLGEQTLEDSDLKTGLAIITKRLDTGSPWVLTNNPRAEYWNDPPDFSHLGNRHYRIADLVCASAAAPYYFAPKKIRMIPKTSGLAVSALFAEASGVFVDGGVSPFNNPALMLLMLAGVKGYKFDWSLGADQLFMVSVGTGSYRLRIKPSFLMRWFPPYFAAKALQSLAADADAVSLTLMQWLSKPNNPWEINSEIGDMKGEVLHPAEHNADPKPLLSFVRYDTRLEMPWLSKALGDAFKTTLNEGFLEGLKQLDRPDMMRQMYDVGAVVAAAQVTPADFRQNFDVAAGSGEAPQPHPLFSIERTGRFARKARLIARRQLTPADFRAVSVKLGKLPLKARRTGLVAARQATASEKVETHWNGKESQDTAAPGDWIVTNLSAQGQVMRDKAGFTNMYVIRADKFASLYDRHAGETEGGAIYKAKGEVQALYFSGGFDLVAPWGERQQAPQGYLLLNGNEVYGNNRETFAASYQIVG